MIIATLLSINALPARGQGSFPEESGSSVVLDSGTDALLKADGASSPEAAPPTTPADEETLEQSLYGEDDARNAMPAEPDAQSRSWKVNLHASASNYYDSNILSSHSHRESDDVSNLSAGGGVTLGDYTARQYNYLISDYTGIAELFGSHGNLDAYEQKASLEAQILSGHFTFHGDFQFQDLDDENIDTNGRTRREYYTGDLDIRYSLSDKSYLEGTGKITDASYTSYLDSNDESGAISFNYLPDPDVTLGLGILGGVLNVQHTGSQTYEQILASAKVAATEKFTMSASGGVEDRQTPDDKGLVNAVFDLGASYAPFEGLALTLDGYRRVVNSALYLGSDFIATGISGGASYDLSSRFSLSLQTGYVNDDYRDVTGNGVSERTDDYFFVRPAFAYIASRYLKFELFYNYQTDDSSVETSSFDSAEAGVVVNLQY